MSRWLQAHGLMIGWLTVVWIGLWGTLSWANVLGGLVLGVGLVALLPLSDVPVNRVVRPRAVVRLLLVFAHDLVTASLQVSLLVLRPRLRLRGAVLALPARSASDGLLTLLADVISLTPGTLTLEVDRPRSTLYVHVLDVGPGAHAVERERRALEHIEELAIDAVGSPQCRQALAADLQTRRPDGGRA